ncbi:MAG TPA: alkaline phosphatase family protein [Trebonia sp.]|nr:alkaline phosphatase family protein [Trebonia sp.]
MMENTDYSQFVGSAAMPYLNQIAHQYADYTDAYGWVYPSLPNYVELLSGSDDGTAGNDCDITQPGCSNFTNPTLVDQLEQAGISWNAYYQGDDAGCYQGDGSGNYPYWHNAFRYFKEFSEQCSHISGFGDFLSNLDKPNPSDFQWVVPDLVNSGGDSGTMASGDSWLNGELPKIMDTSWYRQGGQIVILYDTGYNDVGGVNGSSGGQIPMVVVSAHTKGMGQVSTPINTAGVLRSVEHAYGLSYLGNAADAKNGSLGDALLSSRPTTPVNAPEPVSQGAVLSITNGAPRSLEAVHGTISVNSAASLGTDKNQGDTTSLLEVGQNATGQGVIVAPDQQARIVPGTADLESVSCPTATQCYAVGFGALNSDEAVLVSIKNGHATNVTDLPAFIGLYGIACPAASTCYAVGYDNANDADAVTTITNGTAGAPVEVSGGGEWLNSISCPTLTSCYAAGLVNYNPSIVPITSGQPGTAVTIPDAWYVNGIDCTSAGNCLAVGEDSTGEGIVGTLVNGKAGTTTVAKGTEYLYGVACVSAASCEAAGTATQAANGYASGAVVPLTDGKAGPVSTVKNSNGFGQVLPYGKDSYETVGAAYTA